MKRLTQLRELAERLSKKGYRDDAFLLYDELYRSVWTALGAAQTGINEFSQAHLDNSIRAAIEFKKMFMKNVINTTFNKHFNLDVEQTYNEFVFITYGHLKTIIETDKLIKQFSRTAILNEFLILYYLILNGEDSEWINLTLKTATPLFENGHFKKLRSNLTSASVEKFLIESSVEVNNTAWFNANVSILDYLTKIGEKKSAIFNSISQAVIDYATNENKKRKSSARKETYETYETYEKYERYEKRTSYRKHIPDNNDVDYDRLSEKEKAIYFGKVLKLSGKVTKKQIRDNYLQLIGLYHPDKMDVMAPDLLKIAEQNTKKINRAFEWFKEKYSI